MKSDIFDESLESTRLEFLQQQNPAYDSLLCSGNNQAFQLCLNQNCKQTPVFTCATQKCLCQRNHNLCKKGNLQTALEIINSKIKNTDALKQQIDKIFDEMIDKLSDFREELMKEVDGGRVGFVMLSNVEEKLLRISLKEIDAGLMSTAETALLWKSFKDKPDMESDIYKEVVNMTNSFNSTIGKVTESTKKEIFEKVSEFKRFKFSQSTLYSLQKQSNIFQTEQTMQTMIKMFPRKIKSLNLLFQASKNNFSLEKYFNDCGPETDTIIVALTDKNKIFGGYTPFCVWSEKEEWVNDPQQKSFLFSISENQKFLLQHTTRAFYRRNEYHAITFGYDFQICDNVNKNQNCSIGFQFAYRNQKYKNEKDSFLKLNGNETKECSLKEWEVYKVEFEQ